MTRNATQNNDMCSKRVKADDILCGVSRHLYLAGLCTSANRLLWIDSALLLEHHTCKHEPQSSP